MHAHTLGAELAEVLEVVEGQVVAREVQHGVLERARVAVRQHEAVAVELWAGKRGRRICSQSGDQRSRMLFGGKREENATETNLASVTK